MHFRSVIAVVAAALIGSAGLLGATTAPPKSTKSKHHPVKHVASSRGVRKPGARTAATRHPARSTWRSVQTQPTPERYREIQGALAKKGYLHGEPTGKWDDESADALRRFQHDQNLEASGKLDSLSLIALGLGPKY